jgi:acetylornithine deacetylase
MSSEELEYCADLLETWLRIDSTSGREAAFLAALEAYFSGLGFRCERLAVAEDRWNLLVTRTEKPRFLFSTHVDTVPPFFGPRREAASPENQDDARIYGRGACDTKGGIVAMARAGERLLADGIEDFGYLFVVGEEVDHCGAKLARESERLRELNPERIVLCEPTRNRIVAAQKGMLRCRIASRGVAGHSAFPGRGDSAIDHLLDALQTLRTHEWPADELLGPTTLNVGIIEGGLAANVFAPEAHADLLFRCVSDTSELIERVRELVEPDAELSRVVHNDPVFFEPPEGFETCTVPFNTDATYLGELAPIWLVGPGDIEDAHSDHEYISLQSLADGVDLYERLARLALGE